MWKFLSLDLNLTIENNEQGEFTLDNDIPKNGIIHFYKHGYAFENDQV